MYLDYYGFEEEPFNITPDSRFLFLSQRHREALAALLYGIEQRKGFIALTGEIGCGKTTICRAMLGKLDRETTRLALIFNPELSDLELLQAINAEYGIDAASSSKRELLDRLYKFLLEEFENDRNVVLLIDEAQRLGPDALEQVRLISNLETESAKLIQIALVGQPELADILDLPELEQLNQRITVRYHIEPLTIEEVGEYLEHRIEVAQAKIPVRFHKKAVRKIFEYSRGVPRRVNVVSDRALLVTFVNEETEVSEGNVVKAIEEVGGMPRRHARRTTTILPVPSKSELTAESGDAADGKRSSSLPIALAVFLGLVLIAISIQGLGLWNWDGGTADGSDPFRVPTGPTTTPPPEGDGDVVPVSTGGATPTPDPVEGSSPTATPSPDQENAPVEPTPSATPTPVARESETTPTATMSNLMISMLASPTPVPVATTAATPIVPWTYDGNGVVRIDDPAMSYPAAVLTWLEIQRGERLPDAELSSLRAMEPKQIAGLQLTQGRPPLFLREVRLPASLRLLDESSLPALVQMADSADFGPWAVLTLINGPTVEIKDPISGKRRVPTDTLELHMTAVVVPFFDEPGIVGLEPGDEGDAVRALQKKLLIAGTYNGELTGTFDPNTTDAVRQFRVKAMIPGEVKIDEAAAFALLTRQEPQS